MVTPAFRLDVAAHRADPDDRRARRARAGAARLGHRAEPAPHGAAARDADDVAIKGSAGWYARLPTLIEVFGDRGYILGSPELRPERGPSGDFGVVWAPARRSATSIGSSSRPRRSRPARTTRSRSITSAGFVARARTSATPRPTAPSSSRRRGSRRPLSVTASYTRLVTEQLSADPSTSMARRCRASPATCSTRAPMSCAARSAAARDGVARRRWQSESFLDQANLERVPGRAAARHRRARRARRRPRAVARDREPRRRAHRSPAARSAAAPDFTGRRPRSPTSPGFRFPAAASTCPSTGVTDMSP